MKLTQAQQSLIILIERQSGINIQTPKHFNQLSDFIFSKTNHRLSVSTLKRIWGYVSSTYSPRAYTFDILAQCVGYADFKDFCSQFNSDDYHSDVIPFNHVNNHVTKRRKLPQNLVIGSILVFIALGAFLLLRGHKSTPEDLSEQYIIKKGQKFQSYEDYLKLFGVTDYQTYWDKPLPHYQQIVIWGPEYNHPVWHNQGDPSRLLPTITEYWNPNDTTTEKKLIRSKNEDLYHMLLRTHELRITFMKNVVDSNYVFLGVYRPDWSQSDNSKIVWVRVAEQVDLLHLEHLEQLRD